MPLFPPSADVLAQAPLLHSWHDLWSQARPAFRQARTHRRAGELAAASLVCLSRHTITGLLCTQGRHHEDWSAAYRTLQRFDAATLFTPVVGEVCRLVDHDAPLVASLDTTLLGKSGRKVYGARWRRDPLGPKFQANLVWSQRFLQTSLLLPEAAGDAPCAARGIPAGLRHCPGVKRRAPKEASVDEIALHKQAAAQTGAPMNAVEAIADLRCKIDATEGGAARRLLCATDGGLTNRTTLRQLPHDTALVGRIRKDAVLFAPPREPKKAGRGRPRIYGERLATPEQLRQGDDVAWQTVRIFAAGREHDLRIKTVAAVRWSPAGAHDLRLIIIAPLAYRPNASSRLLYRDPAYLVCTDPSMDLRQAIQAYVWRWEIELNFRDEKTILGVGEAQLRRADACENAPALMTAAYAMLLLAAEQTRRDKQRARADLPKWRESQPPRRETTQQIINALRAEILRAELTELNKMGFAEKTAAETKGQKIRESYVVVPMFTQK